MAARLCIRPFTSPSSRAISSSASCRRSISLLTHPIFTSPIVSHGPSLLGNTCSIQWRSFTHTPHLRDSRRPPHNPNKRIVINVPRDHVRYHQPGEEPDKIDIKATIADKLPQNSLTTSAALLVVAAAALFYYWNTDVGPGTGRLRFKFVPESVMVNRSKGEAAALVDEMRRNGAELVNDGRSAMVHYVMARLVAANGLDDKNWESHVVAENVQNALALAGGQVFVFAGLFRVCRDVDELAAVIGHEVAHVTSAHLAERASWAWVTNATIVSALFMNGLATGVVGSVLWLWACGDMLTDYLVELPMSRGMESEADYVGLMMMADAGFDPRKALNVWDRFDRLQKMGGPEIPEVLSTHPSSSSRLAKIQEWMPQAMVKYEASNHRAKGSGIRWASSLFSRS